MATNQYLFSALLLISHSLNSHNTNILNFITQHVCLITYIYFLGILPISRYLNLLAIQRQIGIVVSGYTPPQSRPRSSHSFSSLGSSWPPKCFSGLAARTFTRLTRTGWPDPTPATFTSLCTFTSLTLLSMFATLARRWFAAFATLALATLHINVFRRRRHVMAQVYIAPVLIIIFGLMIVIWAIMIIHSWWPGLGSDRFAVVWDWFWSDRHKSVISRPRGRYQGGEISWTWRGLVCRGEEMNVRLTSS